MFSIPNLDELDKNHIQPLYKTQQSHKTQSKEVLKTKRTDIKVKTTRVEWFKPLWRVETLIKTLEISCSRFRPNIDEFDVFQKVKSHNYEKMSIQLRSVHVF